jgi:carbamoyl-phosphate synthase small subunit
MSSRQRGYCWAKCRSWASAWEIRSWGWWRWGSAHRLKFGHHGCNHPVKDLTTGKVDVTHINLNDGTVEGIAHKREPMFCVQYHPEAGPGPCDPRYLFARFRELIKRP